MKNLYLVLLVLALWGTADASANSLQLKLNLYINYEDDTSNCTTFRTGVEFHAFGKVANGILTEFAVANYPREAVFKPIYREHQFPLPLFPQVEQVDGIWWLKEIHISDSFMRWVFEQASGRSFCKFPKLSRTKAKSSSLDFELEGVRESVLVSYSEVAELSGETAGKQPFKSRIRFVQREKKNLN